MFYVKKLYICIKQKLDGVVYFIGCTKYLLYFFYFSGCFRYFRGSHNSGGRQTSLLKRLLFLICASLTPTLEKSQLIMFDEDHNIIYSDRN